jgi:hypothetical protein
MLSLEDLKINVGISLNIFKDKKTSQCTLKKIRPWIKLENLIPQFEVEEEDFNFNDEEKKFCWEEAREKEEEIDKIRVPRECPLYKKKVEEDDVVDFMINDREHVGATNKKLQMISEAIYKDMKDQKVFEVGNLDKSKEDIAVACETLMTTVKLDSSSSYDVVYWMFFYEDNPYVMNRIKAATVLAIIVHVMFITFYAGALGLGKLPYYGTQVTQIVRIICAMLLHMQMYPQIENARKMLTFLINNPERFATDIILWPGIVTLTKVVTALGAHMAAIVALCTNDNELTMIKFYASAAVIGSLDGKIIGIIIGMYEASTEGDIGSRPLEVGIYQFKSSISAITRTYKAFVAGL